MRMIRRARMALALWFLVFASVGCDGDGGSGDAGDGADGSAERCTGDTACDDGVFCNGAEQCEPSDEDADARGCVAGATAGLCATTEACDATSDMCVAVDCTDPDLDDDGDDSIACGGGDCDDSDPGRFSGNTEICDDDDVDEDCDPLTFGGRDVDSDGYIDAACCNGDACGDDCDDGESSVHPTNSESCDGLDNDCDELTDEGVRTTYYLDRDADSSGDPAMSMEACGPSGLYTATNAGDCDDLVPSVNPGAPEVCDARDNDCNPLTWAVGEDDDGDGYLNAACGGDDCNDDDALTYPGAPEPCNGFDNDCSGDTEDADGDGYVDPRTACTGGPYPKTDCEDTHPGVNRGHVTFEEEPYCPGEIEPCTASGSRALRCRSSASASCTSGLPTASYDWDCSGTAQPEAAHVPMCSADCDTPTETMSGDGTVCEDLGYNYACDQGPNYAGAPPSCGSTVSYESCCCDGIGNCSSQIFDRDWPLRCR